MVYIVELVGTVLSIPINAVIKAYLKEEDAKRFADKINKEILSKARNVDCDKWVWLMINPDTEEVLIDECQDKDWKLQYTIGRFTFACVDDVASAF